MNHSTWKFEIAFPSAKRFECGSGARLFLIDDKKAALSQLRNLLTESHFTLQYQQDESQNRFFGFSDGHTLCHVEDFACEEVLRVLFEEQTESSGLFPSGKAVCHPTVTQVRLSYCDMGCGMSYVIRTEEGKFVIIDGGFNEYEETERLLELLQEQNPLDDIPQIQAWIITHPHSDHFGVFTEFVTRFADKAIIERVMFNFPSLELCDCEWDDTAGFDRVIEQLRKSGTKMIIPHTGQRFIFGDTVWDVLFACEDMYPELKVAHLNYSSLVFRMECRGRRFMWLSDSGKKNSDIICRHFGESSLQSEFLQVAHHGFNGGSAEIYRAIDPKQLFWPCPDYWYPIVRQWDRNTFFLTSGKIQNVFRESNETTVADLTGAVPDQKSADAFPYVFTGQTAKRIVDLHWECLAESKTYPPKSLLLTSDGCLIQADGHCLCRILRSDEMESAPSFSLHLIGKGNCEKLAIVYNQPNLMDPIENEIPISVESDGEVDVTLTVDATKQTAALQGTSLGIYPYIPQKIRSLCLYVEKGDFLIRKIEVQKI